MKFTDHNILTGEVRDIEHRVRLSGDGWYIEVYPTEDGHGLVIRTDDSRMVVLPDCRNMIEVRTELGRRQTIYAEAERIVAVQKQIADASGPLRKRTREKASQ